MHTISCPSCHRLLNLPPEAVGQPVRCPSCACVFDHQTQVAPRALPKSPPSLSPAVERPDVEWSDEPRLPRRRLDPPFERRREETYYDPERIRAKSLGAAWLMFMATGINVFAGVLFFYQMLAGSNDPGARLLGLLCVLVFFVPPAVFVLVGGILLTSLRGWGMIFTSAIMAMVLGVFLLIAVFFMATAYLNQFAGPAPDTVYLEIALFLAGAVVNIAVGIRSLVVIHHEDVRSAFR